MAANKQIPETVLPPETVDVLGRRFKVKLLEPDESEDDDGYMEIGTQTIGLRLQPGLNYNQDTLLHEITHAVDETLLLGMKERQVHLLATGILAVLKQNKELTAWLLKDE
jgi:hypothetical protein